MEKWVKCVGKLITSEDPYDEAMVHQIMAGSLSANQITDKRCYSKWIKCVGKLITSEDPYDEAMVHEIMA